MIKKTKKKEKTKCRNEAPYNYRWGFCFLTCFWTIYIVKGKGVIGQMETFLGPIGKMPAFYFFNLPFQQNAGILLFNLPFQQEPLGHFIFGGKV